MKFSKLTKVAFAIAAILSTTFSACTVNYSLSGTSIHKDTKTYSVAYFPNNAPMVAPILSPTLTDAMKDKLARQTRLSEVREGGDLHFEGNIVGYSSTPSAISGDEYAAKNKLTITVRVSFTDNLQPQYNFTNKTFSGYLEYNSSQLLQEVEGQLITDIVDQITDDIFKAALSNW